MGTDQNRIDLLVGRRIRERRTSLGISQTKLAEAIAVSYQQVQKYESGRNKVSSGRLLLIANKLGVTPSYFFDSGRAGVGGRTGDGLEDVARDDECSTLVDHFRQIKDANIRNDLLTLVRSMAAAFPDDVRDG